MNKDTGEAYISRSINPNSKNKKFEVFYCHNLYIHPGYTKLISKGKQLLDLEGACNSISTFSSDLDYRKIVMLYSNSIDDVNKLKILTDVDIIKQYSKNDFIRILSKKDHDDAFEFLMAVNHAIRQKAINKNGESSDRNYKGVDHRVYEITVTAAKTDRKLKNLFKILTPNKKKRCTVTMLKHQNKCHFITNYHCFQDTPGAKVTIRPPNSTKKRMLISYTNIDIESILLSFPNDKLPKRINKDCNELDNVQLHRSSNLIQKLMVAGYSKGELKIYGTSINSPLESFIKKNTALPEINEKGVYNFDNFRVDPGQSGGALINAEVGRLLGIIYHRKHIYNNSRFITLSTVLDFIDYPTRPLSFNERYPHAMTYLTSKPEEEKPGDNMGGSALISPQMAWKEFKLKNHDKKTKLPRLFDFLEKPEGIIQSYEVMNNIYKKRLVAIFCNGKWNQIDDYENFINNSCSDSQESVYNYLYAGTYGFPLEESEHSSIAPFQLPISFNEHMPVLAGKSYQEISSVREGVRTIIRKSHENNFFFRFDINSRKVHIRIDSSAKESLGSETGSKSVNIKYKIETQENRNMIILTPQSSDEKKLFCPLTNFLKLTCKSANEDVTMNISMSDSLASEVDISYTYVTEYYFSGINANPNFRPEALIFHNYIQHRK